MTRKVPGLALRGNTWWLDFRHDGKRYQVKIGKNISKTVAKEIAQRKRSAVIGGEAGVGRKKRDIKFDKAVELFLAWAKTDTKPLTAKFYEDCCNALLKEFSGKRLSQITVFSLEAYKSKRKQSAPVRCNRELVTLRRLYSRCIDWGKYEGQNPASIRKNKFKLLPESHGKERVLSDTEETAFISAATEPFRTVLMVCLHCGVRMASEGLSLSWRNVDLTAREVTIEAEFAKNGIRRTIPINSTLYEALKAHRVRAGEKTKPDDHVFLTRTDKPLRDVRSRFYRARDKAGLDASMTPHTLRHTWATRLGKAGTPARVLQILGGWKSLKMVEHYCHPDDDALRKAVESLTEEGKKALRDSLNEEEAKKA